MKKLLLVLLLFAFWCNNNAHAELEKVKGHYVFDVIPMSIPELTSHSAYILSGSVKSKELIQVSGIDAVKYTINVETWFKGKERWSKNHDPNTFTYTQWAAVEGTTSSKVGDKIISGFSYPSKEYGFSTTTGLQFDFKVFEDKKGKTTVKVAKRLNTKDFNSAFTLKNKNLKLSTKELTALNNLSKEESVNDGSISADSLKNGIKELVSTQGEDFPQD